MLQRISAAVSLLLMLACGGGGNSGDDADGGVVPGGPAVTALIANMESLSDGQSVTFTATVSDPDGITDVELGRLEDPSGTVHYGDFASSGGAEYTASLDWTTIHQKLAIEFDEPIDRTFRAEFTDAAGHVGWRDVSIRLTCGDASACAGRCTDTRSSAENCGMCNRVCPIVAGIGGCKAGACEPTLSECAATPIGITCDDICGGMSRTCVTGACGSTAIDYGVQSDCESATSVNGSTSAACDAPLPELFGISRCCCTVP